MGVLLSGIVTMSLLETGELAKVTSYIGIGDQYTDKKERPLHETPGVRQFQTTGGVKKGQTGGDWGENYRGVKPLYEGEKYTDLAKIKTRERLASRERFVEPKGFVPSSPARQRTGPGTYDGAFTRYEHLDEGRYPKRGEIKRIDPDITKPRNFVTSPSKRGGFGYPGTTIGARPEYVAEPYHTKNAGRKAEEEDKPPPFKSASAPRGCLDTPEHTVTGASAVYRRDDRCLPPKKDPTEGKTKKELAEAKEAAKGYEKPFVQSHPAKRGYNSTFNKFPEHPSEKYDPKVIQRALQPSRLAPEAERRKKLMPKKLVDRPAFKPSSGRKSGLSRSIAHAGYHVATAGMRRSYGRRR